MSTTDIDRYKATLVHASALAWKAVSRDAGWKLLQQQHGVQVYTQTDSATHIKSVKGVGFIPLPPDIVAAFFGDVHKRKLYDENLLSVEDLELINDEVRVVRSCFKAPWPVDNRDVVVAGTMIRTMTGGFFAWATSVVHPKAPVNPRFVRAELIYYGLNVEAAVGGCRVVYATATNPRGNISPAIANTVQAAQGFCVYRVRELLCPKSQDAFHSSRARGLIHDAMLSMKDKFVFSAGAIPVENCK